MSARSDPLTSLPANRRLVLQFALALLLALAAQVNLQLTFRLVHHPVPLGLANLEADPEVVRSWYRLLREQGTYLQMIRTELVDLLWALALGVALVTMCRAIGGLLRRAHPPIAGLLVRWAPLAAIGPVCDLIENAFSLAMLTDPWGFPGVVGARPRPRLLGEDRRGGRHGRHGHYSDGDRAPHRAPPQEGP